MMSVTRWCNDNRWFHLLLAILCLALLVEIGNAKHTKSNVLFIIVDDLRPALGCYGDARAHTPSIDGLAERSVLFQHAYAQQALCAPSRNSLLTSRRPDTLGLYDFYSYWRLVAGNYTSLPQHLKNNGYATMSVGKVFHPGASCNHSDDSPYSWTDPPFHPPTERYKDAPVCSRRNSTPTNNLVCPVQVSTMPSATLPDIETLDAARSWLNDNRDREPFFLAVGFQKPHIPLKYPKRYLKYHPLEKFSLPDNYEWPQNVSSVAYNPWTDFRRRSDIESLGLECPWEKIPKKYARRIIQSYYAAVTYVDNLIGRLLDELDRLKIRDDTIIILTSDHGWSLGEHAEWAKYSNFEVALRVPLIISIPNVTYHPATGIKSCTKNSIDGNHSIKSNAKIVPVPVELLDLFPTVAELVGFPVTLCSHVEGDSKMLNLCTDGTSLIPLIEAAVACKTISWKSGAISQYPRPGLRPICKPSSDEPRLRQIKIMGYTLRTVRYRYTVWVSFSPLFKKPNWDKVLAEELYDHDNDFGENFNLAGLENLQQIKRNLKDILVQSLH